MLRFLSHSGRCLCYDTGMRTLDLPIVRGQNQLSYGGHQAWYDDRAARRAGCGSVAAANSLAVLAGHDSEAAACLDLWPDSDGRYSRQDYLAYMQGIYRRMGCGLKLNKPVGITVSRYVRSVLIYASERNLYLRPHILLTPYCSASEAESFLKDAFDAGAAVTLALSWNQVPVLFSDKKKPQIRPVKNHYVTISGIDEDAERRVRLIISTWGRKASLLLDDLAASWQSPKAVDTALIFFTPDGDERSLKKALRQARWLVLKTVLCLIPGHRHPRRPA